MISEGVLQPACRIECLLFRLRVCDEIPPFKRLPGHTIQAAGERLVAFKYEESMPGVASGGAVRFRFRRAVRFGFRRSVFFRSRRPVRFPLLVKFIPITKKEDLFPPPTRVHSSNSATDEWNTTTVTYLVSPYPLECGPRKRGEPIVRHSKYRGIASPLNAALNRL